jgi:TetR/AcrR family transcriptional regulator, tetracycline repressor protein
VTERPPRPRRSTRRARLAAPETLEERRDLIVAAALDLLDTDGFDQLSLRRLAGHLGMHAPGLYWYIESKQDLLDLMAKEILNTGLATLERPAAGASWQRWLVELACATRLALLARRDGARVVGSAFLLKAGALTPSIEISLEILETGGFERLPALGATMTLIRYAIGAALGEQVSPMAGIVDKAELDRKAKMMLSAIDEKQWPRTAEAYRMLFESDARDRPGIRDRDRVFRWGAEMFVRGFADYPTFPPRAD